jgi:choice-of-anchor C domain-containing protein
LIDVKKILFVGIMVVLLLASVGAVSAAPNLVLDPGFETPVISGNWITYPVGVMGSWNIDAQSIDLIHDGWDPANGDQSIDLSGDNRGTISQLINTVPGKTYKLSFAMAGNTYEAPQKKTVEVLWDGSSKGTFDFNTNGYDTTNMGWTVIGPITGLQASSDSTTKLEFKDITASGDVRAGVALDDVVVEEEDNNVPVPEFPSIALPAALIVGLLGVVLFIQKSKDQ